jgi:hypothetical protein
MTFYLPICTLGEMRRSFATAALLAIVAVTPAFGGNADTTERFTALTYNVAGLPEPLSGSEPATNTRLISPLLNDYDLVLVQEDWVDPDPPVAPFDFYHDDLISAVDFPHLSIPATPPLGSDSRRPEALVADGLNFLSRYPFGEITREMWTGCFGGLDTSDGGAADCASQKGFAFTRLEIAPDLEIDLYNLHAEAGSTAADVEHSAADFEQLAAFIAEHSRRRAVIVGGDFNLHTDEEPDATVFETFLDETGLADVCDELGCGRDADQIDKFVFRSGGGVEIEALRHRFVRRKFQRDDGEPLSDHDPLAVTFRVRG